MIRETKTKTKAGSKHPLGQFSKCAWCKREFPRKLFGYGWDIINKKFSAEGSVDGYDSLFSGYLCDICIRVVGAARDLLETLKSAFGLVARVRCGYPTKVLDKAIYDEAVSLENTLRATLAKAGSIRRLRKHTYKRT